MKTLSRSLIVISMAWVALLATPMQVTAVEIPDGRGDAVFETTFQGDEGAAVVLASGRHWRHAPRGYFRNPGRHHFRGGHHFRGHRYGHSYRRPYAHRYDYYGHRLRAYPYGYYGRGRHGYGSFGVSGCFTSGSVRICINNRYRH